MTAKARPSMHTGRKRGGARCRVQYGASLRLEVRAVGQGCGAGEVDAGVFDRRERAHSREGGFVATTLLHGPVVVGVPRVGEVFRELRAEVLEGRERRGEPVVGVEMDGLLRRRRAVAKALRRSCEHGLQRIVSRHAGRKRASAPSECSRVDQRIERDMGDKYDSASRGRHGEVGSRRQIVGEKFDAPVPPTFEPRPSRATAHRLSEEAARRDGVFPRDARPARGRFHTLFAPGFPSSACVRA